MMFSIIRNILKIKSQHILIILFYFINLFNLHSQNKTYDSLQIKTYSFNSHDLNIYAKPKTSKLDTSLDNFQIYRPFHKESFFYRDLGNLGTPVFSLLCNQENFCLLEPSWFPFDFFSYGKYPTILFNSKIPLTYLFYENGANEENLFEVFHTQNVRRNFNIGLKFRVINSKGEYLSQNTNHRNFRSFLHYSTKIPYYQSFIEYYYNRIYLAENGGIDLHSFNTNSTDFNYSVHLKKAISNYINKGITIKNFLNFSIKKKLLYVDTIKKVKKDSLIADTLTKKIVHIYDYFPIFRISHLYRLNHKRHSFFDDLTRDFSYYDTFYYNNMKTFDSSYFLLHTNRFLIHKLSNQEFKSLLNNFHAYTGIEIQNISYNNNYLSLLNDFYLKKNYSNAIALFSVGFEKNTFKFNSEFNYVVEGYNKKNSELNLLFTKRFKKANTFTEVSYKNGQKKPQYFYYENYSNAYAWHNPTFGDIKYSTLSIIQSIYGFKLQFIHNFKKDVIYFDTTYTPKQYNGAINCVSIIFSKNLKYKWFNFNNIIAFQDINENPAIDVPKISTYSSIYADLSIIKKRLQTQFGADLWFHSKYYANGYNPAIPSFYSQRNMKNGNYPYLDLFLNVLLKRARGFVKLENILDNLVRQNYFEAYNYLMQGRALRFGISWYLLY